MQERTQNASFDLLIGAIAMLLGLAVADVVERASGTELLFPIQLLIALLVVGVGFVVWRRLKSSD